MEAKNVQNAVRDVLNKIWDDSVVAVQRAEGEFRNVTGRLVEKGKITQGDAQKIFENLRKKMDKRRSYFEERLDEGTRWALVQLNIPTKSEVVRLSGRVDNLSRKIRTLKRQMTA